MHELSAQVSLHPGEGAARRALGARGGAGESPDQARSQSRRHDRAALDRRAPVRHDQVLDGGDALSLHHAAESGDGDGAQCARLQHEARDENHGRRQTAGGDAGGNGLGSLEIRAPMVASGRLQAVTGRDLASNGRDRSEKPARPRGLGRRTQSWGVLTQPGPSPVCRAFQ